MTGGARALAASIDAEVSQARQLVRDSHYEEAYQLLLPFAEQGQDNAVFNALLGESALGTNRADQALAYFRRSLAADPDSVDAHLGLARAYLAMGNYASAKIEFETVLRIDNLPRSLQRQDEIYAQAARDYAQGNRLLPYAYAMAGYGNYSVNATDGTDEFGGSDTDDNFLNARGGGGLTYLLNDNYALKGSLDFDFRDYYNNDDRNDDKDLRWDGAVSRNLGENNLAVGVREFDFTLTDTLGGFVFAWWQHDDYNAELLNVDAEDNILGVGEREDNLYEAGAGLTWQFADSWSLNPEILNIYEDSNTLANEYSSTEVWFTVRKDF